MNSKHWSWLALSAVLLLIAVQEYRCARLQQEVRLLAREQGRLSHVLFDTQTRAAALAWRNAQLEAR